MPQIDTPGGALWYEQQGAGTPFVLLPGLGRHLRHWNGLDTLLAEHFQVITYDPMGTGLSSGRAAFSVEGLALEVLSLLDALGIRQAHLLGLSLGGMVALAFSAAYPERVLSQFVINSSIGGLGIPRLERAALDAMVRSAIWKDRWLEFVLPVALGPRVSFERQRAIMIEWSRLESEVGPISSWVTTQHFYAATQFRLTPSVSQLSVPTYILYGTEDRFVTPNNSLAMGRAVPKSHVIAVEGAGHELHLEDPHELVRLVEKAIGLLPV